MENSELKAKTKSVYQIIKSLDEHKSNSTSISLLLSDIGAEVLRKKLVALIESILLEDFETIGKKTRDILWRKVYYDPISTSKRLWKKSEKELSDSEATLLYEFIKRGIKHYKTLILKFEDVFNLDIRYIIDFSIIANGADAFEKRSEKEIYTVNETNHAMETIHNFLISLGDLHRYCIEFKFAERDKFLAGSVSNKQLAASYYIEAFKLNPKIGMPHNQLGTLVSGENYEIDSIFHYLYSLCSLTPVELSETNVCRIFQQNNEMLVAIEPSCDGFNIRDFMMQVILLIDIFFYDKDIADFNSICFSVLMNFKDYLIKCHRNSQPDVTFQLTSIFLLCLLKLKRSNSSKVQCLNAFLLAFCAKIVDVVVEKIDDFIAEHMNQNLEFSEEYNRKYQEFDKQIKKARDLTRNQKSSHFVEALKDSGIEKNCSSNSQKDGSGSNRMSGDSKITMSQSSGKSHPGDFKIVKRPTQNNNNNRRRRKRRGLTESSSSEESETESIFSDDDNSDVESMNSDFDSYGEDECYVNMRFSSDDDSEDDNEDILIESEEIVYKNGETPNQLTFQEENSDDIVVEEEKIIFHEDQPDEEIAKMLKMKYKKKYTKVDPNLILEFSKLHEGWMKSLKVLFDWLHLDTETLDGCYRSNPEFIGKIIRFINFINIDIFTRKIYFDRSMIKFKNIRGDLRFIFDNRHQIATSEDITFKKCVMFEELQQTLDWNLNYKLQITPEEDIVLRVFKMIDFGFHLSKVKKFNYSFCARSRIFIEKQSRRRGESRRSRKNSDDSRRRFKNDDHGNRRERKRNRRRRRDRAERKSRNSECDRFEKLSLKTPSQENHEVEEFPSIEKSNQCSVRKGYLMNKIAEKEKSEEQKNEMMGKLGKLWLKNEVQTLESRSKPNTNLTPYLMLDTNALIDYLYVVKNLVKTKKFIVLIPKAVLQDIDGLKKSKDGARNAIKWLEAEFLKGNRFLRTQRDSEVLQMPYLKVPSKLEREDTVFMNIVPFANFIVSNNSSDCGSDLPVLTLLTGDNLDNKKSTMSNINQVGILESIPVKYDQIYRFFSKCKKK